MPEKIHQPKAIRFVCYQVRTVDARFVALWQIQNARLTSDDDHSVAGPATRTRHMPPATGHEHEGSHKHLAARGPEEGCEEKKRKKKRRKKKREIPSHSPQGQNHDHFPFLTALANL